MPLFVPLYRLMAAMGIAVDARGKRMSASFVSAKDRESLKDICVTLLSVDNRFTHPGVITVYEDGY